jgi:ferredoxin-NADP reductase
LTALAARAYRFTPMHIAESELTLVIESRENAADGVIALSLRDPTHAELPAWQPGAHIDLILSNGLTRQYSLCGDPRDRRAYRIGVLREPQSRGGSQHIHDALFPGTLVQARGPRNHFELAPAERYLFIGGGIGITPLIPMIAHANAAGADWKLVFGGRTRASMAFASELQSLYPGRVSLHPQNEAGLLPLAALLREPSLETHVYCCGPEPLLAAVEAHCGTWSANTLHVERFAPKARSEPVTNAGFEVELANSGVTLFVPADKSLLQVLQENGVEVLSACCEGTCGTCETEIVEGAAEHRDSILTPAERATQKTLMVCVSRAAGRKLVLRL